MSDKIIHLPDPDIDYSLCGDSDDGVMVDGGQPNYNTNGEEVNCPRCLRIIAVCKDYTAQHSATRRAEAWRKKSRVQQSSR